MRIVLIMPRGALYRHEKGIFRKPIRYAPLTLTTLAALVPAEIDADIEIIDEGVQTLPDSLEADLVGMTAITGTSMRAYAIADRFRTKGIPVVLGGVRPSLIPEDAYNLEMQRRGLKLGDVKQTVLDKTPGWEQRFHGHFV